MSHTRLLSLLKIFQKAPVIFYRHIGLIQVVYAVVLALQLAKTTSWESLLGAQKVRAAVLPLDEVREHNKQGIQVLVHTAMDPSHPSLVAQLTRHLVGGEPIRFFF